MDRATPHPAPIALVDRLSAIGARALFALLVMALAWGGIALTRGGEQLAALWLPNAVLTAVILRNGWRGAHSWVIAAACGFLMANLFAHFAFADAVALAAINCGEALGASWLLLHWQKRQPDMAVFDDLARFTACCCIVAPGISGLASAWWMAPAGMMIDVAVWRSWTLADGLGMLIAAPVVLIAIDAWPQRHRLARHRLREIALILGGNAAAAVFVFGQSQYPLLFLGLPMVFLAAFRLGIVGTAAAVAVVSLVATGATLLGTGPMMLIEGSLATRIHVLQLFLATAFVIGLPVAAAMAARERIREELKRSRDFPRRW